MDRLLRYILHQDATESVEKKGRDPLVFQCLVWEYSPIRVALEEASKLLDDDSDLVWVLRWHWQVRDQEVDQLYYHQHASVATKMALQQWGTLFSRAQLNFASFPLRCIV